MSKMIPEEKFKDNLIARLNNVKNGWIDGDSEDQESKTVDIINHNLKIAIEIKDDTTSKPNTETNGQYDIKEINRIHYNHIKSANKKFRGYNGYKTVLILRSPLPDAGMIRYAIEGMHTFGKPTRKDPGSAIPARFIASSGLVYKGRKDKHKRKEIGCFLVLMKDGCYYFPNTFSETSRTISKSSIEKMFSRQFTYVEKA